MGAYRNIEGYRDPTAGDAFKSIAQKNRNEERLEKIGLIISIIKKVAELAGFEVVGRITLLDKKTGREYK